MDGNGKRKPDQLALLESSMDALGMRIHLAQQARSRIDLQYYILHDGLTTRLLLQALLDAADRGVQVRLLLDDMTLYGQDARIAALACHANIDVRLFNPLEQGRRLALTRVLAFLARLPRMHRRMHNKLWLVDGETAITGGRNLGDEYYGAATEMNFSDLDILLRGPICSAMQDSFDSYWHSPFVLPVARFRHFVPNQEEHRLWRLRVRDRLRASMRVRQDYVRELQCWQHRQGADLLLAALRDAPLQLLVDRPEKIGTPEPPAVDELVFAPLIERVRAVQQELILVSAYFVPGELGMALLQELRSRGVRVCILTNSLAATDLPLVHGGYSAYREKLLAMGVELFEMRARPLHQRPLRAVGSRRSLHSKMLVFDRCSAFVGSFNLDPRSAFWNTEIGVLFDQPAISAELAQLALQGMAPAVSFRLALDRRGRLIWYCQGRQDIKIVRRERGWPWRRFLAWFSRCFAPARWL